MEQKNNNIKCNYMNDIQDKEVLGRKITDSGLPDGIRQWIESKTWITFDELLDSLKKGIRKELEDAGYE